MRSKGELQSAIRQGGRAILVVNVQSRRGRRMYGTARHLLAEAGLEFAEVFPVVEPERLNELFDDVLALEPDLVVVGGGDGTIAEAVGHLTHRDIALGVLPLGTTNNFARSTATAPGDAAPAADPAKHIFANMVSLGLSVNVAERVPHELKRFLGRAAYALTAAWLLPRHEAFRATIRIDDETHEMDTHQLNVANGAHHSGRRIARDASPDDRLLAVYRLGDRRRLRLASATARHVLTGQWRSLAEDAFLTTDHVHIETDPPMNVDVDGEIRGRTPVTVRLLGNALRVVVPQSFVDT